METNKNTKDNPIISFVNPPTKSPLETTLIATTEIKNETNVSMFFLKSLMKESTMAEIFSWRSINSSDNLFLT